MRHEQKNPDLVPFFKWHTLNWDAGAGERCEKIDEKMGFFEGILIFPTS